MLAVTIASTAAFLVAVPAAEAAPITFVKGTVTAVDTGAPMANVGVAVFVDQGERGVDPSSTLQTTTDSSGNYSFHIRSGSYVVEFDPALPYISNRVPFGTPKNFRATLNDVVQLGATIAGTITDATTGQPLEGICVVPAMEPNCTDAQGHYEIDGVEPSNDFFVSANGVYNVNPDYDSASSHVVTTAGQTTQADFALQPTARALVTVLGSDGQPVQGVSVTGGNHYWSGGPYTDANGQLLVRGLRPRDDGTALLSFTPPASDTADAGTAVAIPVQRGQTTSYTVTLPAIAVLTVHVVHPDGSAHQGDCLGMVPVQPDAYTSSWSSGCTDATDTVTLRIAPGTYNYDLSNASTARDEPTNANGSLTAAAGAGDAEIDIPTIVLGTVTGVVTDQSTGLPLAGVTVLSDGVSTTTGTDGTYSLGQLGRTSDDVFVGAQPNDGIHNGDGREVTLVRGGTVTVNFALPISPGL